MFVSYTVFASIDLSVAVSALPPGLLMTVGNLFPPTQGLELPSLPTTALTEVLPTTTQAPDVEGGNPDTPAAVTDADAVDVEKVSNAGGGSDVEATTAEVATTSEQEESETIQVEETETAEVEEGETTEIGESESETESETAETEEVETTEGEESETQDAEMTEAEEVTVTTQEFEASETEQIETEVQEVEQQNQ